jgi:hypothetical protein
VRKASNKPVRLVANRYPVYTGLRQFEYLVSHARRNGFTHVADVGAVVFGPT